MGLSLDDLKAVTAGMFQDILVQFLTAQAKASGKITQYRKATQEDIDAFFGKKMD